MCVHLKTEHKKEANTNRIEWRNRQFHNNSWGFNTPLIAIDGTVGTEEKYQWTQRSEQH